MAGRVRGRERLVICDACGRTVPKDKSVSYGRTQVYSTELRSAEDVKATSFVEQHYCISCAKHRRIFEKLKRRAIAASKKPSRWSSGKRW